MKGFSLHQPWAWALVYRDKVENRPMRPPANMIGQRFAIQAAKTWDDDAIPFMKKIGIDLPLMDPHAEPQANDARLPEFERMVIQGAIIGVATLKGYVSTQTDLEHDLTPDERRWFVGPYGYIVENRIPLKEPVPCRGMQGRPASGQLRTPGTSGRASASPRRPAA